MRRIPAFALLGFAIGAGGCVWFGNIRQNPCQFQTCAPSGGSAEDPCVNVAADESNFAALGAGSSAAPYVLCTAAQLTELSYAQTAWSAWFVLGRDVDLDAFGPAATRPFLGIGSQSTPYSGSFDGGGKTVSNVQINTPTRDDAGFFHVVAGSAAEVKNLTLQGASVVGRDRAGIVAGSASLASIINCVVSGSVSGRDHIGGVVGEGAPVVLSTSASTAVVTGRSRVGGLIGSAQAGSFLINNAARGEVIGSDTVGGHIGSGSNAFVKNSYATGSVTATSGNGGGFIGFSDLVIIKNSFAIGSVTSAVMGGVSGAFVGDGYHGTSNCFYYGNARCNVTGGSCAPPAGDENPDPALTDFYLQNVPPMKVWDFVRTWRVASGSFPVLQPTLFDYADWGDCSKHTKDLPFAGGHGTPESPYLICTPAQLRSLSEPSYHDGVVARVMADLDMAGSPQSAFPLADDTSDTNIVLYGNGKSIANLSFSDHTQRQTLGLFAKLNGLVVRLALTGVDISSDAVNAGVLTGNGRGLVVADCYTSGAISGAGRTMGVSDASAVMNSYSTAAVTSTGADALGIGSGALSGCFASATITGKANSGELGVYQVSPQDSACARDGQVTDSYFDSAAACVQCCAPAYGSEVPLSGFYDPTQPPLLGWDFVNVWRANSGALPTLR